MNDEKKTEFLCKPTELPKNCPKCGEEATFEKNEESEGAYEIIRIRCNECHFTWIEYYRFEKWEPMEE